MFLSWRVKRKYCFVALDTDKITYRVMYRTISNPFTEIKSVFFYKLNHSQLVINLINGKKRYIPVKVEHQAEYLVLLKETLVRNNLYNDEVEKIINSLLKKAK